MFILQTFTEPLPCAKMFCSCICDHIICFDVHLLGGKAQSDASGIGVAPGGLWEYSRGGTSSREGNAGACQRRCPGGLWSRVQFENCGPEEASLPRLCPCRSHPSAAAENELRRARAWLTEAQAPAHNLGLSLPLPCSSRLPGLTVVLIAPEFSSGWQFSQSKH